MKIDLMPILSGELKELPFTFTENVTGEVSDIYFKGLDVVPCGNINVDGKVCDISGFYELRCAVSLPYVTHCSRCGKEIRCECKSDMQLIVSSQGEHDDDDGYIIYSDRQIELDSPVYEELSISFPSKPLCKTDCKGLCPVCGQDLNEGDCEHSAPVNENAEDTL